MQSSIENLFTYQRQRLALLLGWGLVSSMFGLVQQLNPRLFWRQFGLQALLWGVIDAVIAQIGRLSTSRKALRLAQGDLSQQEIQKEGRNFWWILLVNAGLDISYIVTGGLLGLRSTETAIQGTGWGVLVQGLWLFLFDSFLANEVNRRWLR